MYYRIADIVLDSQLRLPAFSEFQCEPCKSDVTLNVVRETPPDNSEVHVGTFMCRKVENGWFFHHPSVPEKGLITSSDYSYLHLIRQDENPVSPQEQQFIRTALECVLARRGYVSLHAACISLDGEAIAFTGVSGMGKSVRAAAWQAAFQASLVSGDRPLINIAGPEACGVPWDGKEGCYRSVRYPLKAICEIRRSGPAYIRRLTARQKQRLLMRQCFIPMWDPETATIQMANIARLAVRARIVRTFCGPRPEDAKALRELMDTQQELKEEPDMKAKQGFILRNIMDDYMIMPIGDNINQFSGTLLLNEMSAFVWEILQHPVSREDLLAAILDTYAVDEAKASADLDELLSRMKDFGVIEEEI